MTDASAVIASVMGPDERLPDRLSSEDLAAPDVLDLEIHHALRGLVLGGELHPREAEELRGDYLDVAIERYPHGPLLDRVWELRGGLTAYDAAYVALAEALDVPLVTTDRRLSRAKGHRAEIELF